MDVKNSYPGNPARWVEELTNQGIFSAQAELESTSESNEENGMSPIDGTATSSTVP